MSDSSRTIDELKRPLVIVSIVAAVVIVILWLVVVFLPAGSKLSSLSAQQTTLRQKVSQGDTQVAALKKQTLDTPALDTRLAQLNTYVPATDNTYNYVTLLTATAKRVGMTYTDIATKAPTVPAGASAAKGTKQLTTIPVTFTGTGTYDELLSFITAIYGLPRLTDINGVRISGGGPGTTRSTPLTVSLTLSTFTTAVPVEKS